jgi:hypothetical protein
MKTDGIFMNTKYYECLGTDLSLTVTIMEPFRQCGRNFFLKQLSHIDEDSRDKNIRHIFERSDLFYKSEINAKLKPGFKQEVGLNCAHWADHATELLGHLVTDIDLAVKIEHWDKTILRHVLSLIEFLIDCCGARQDLESSFSNLSERKKKTKILVRGGREKKYSDIKDSLTESIQRATNAQSSLLTHLLSAKTNISGTTMSLMVGGTDYTDSKIPTATLRELFLLNQAYLQKTEIWSQVEKTLHQTSTATANEAAIPALADLEIISKEDLLF